MNQSPKLSIVITTYNEGESIVSCVRSLVAQNGAPEFEVIVVDDRSTDGSAAMLEALKIPTLTVIRLHRFEHGFLTSRQVALDVGFRAARGEFIFVTDADAIVPRNWLAGLSDRRARTGADAVGGPVRFVPAPNGVNRLVATMQTVDGAFYTGICALLNAVGCESGFVFGNCAFRREAYLKTGGYEAMGFGLTEDLVFSRALRRNGGKLSFVAKPTVSVRACGSWSILIRRALRIGAGGVSALSVLLGVWMPLWIALAIGLLASPGWFLGPFIIRHLLGAGFTAWWLARGGQWKLLPWSLVYEPAAIVTGLMVIWAGRKKNPVAWGGVDYDR